MVVISDRTIVMESYLMSKMTMGFLMGIPPTGDSEEVQRSLTWRRGCKGKQEEADAVEEEFKPEMSL